MHLCDDEMNQKYTKCLAQCLPLPAGPAQQSEQGGGKGGGGRGRLSGAALESGVGVGGAAEDGQKHMHEWMSSLS